MAKEKPLKYEKVVVVPSSDMRWAFNDSKPYYDLKPLLYDYHTRIYIDPFPCATHDLTILKQTIKTVESKFRIGAPNRWVVIPNDTTHYTNAYAEKLYIRDDDKRKKYKFEGLVVMAGKRTIVHPSMTKYLVAHEYGHLVDYWITAKMNEANETTLDNIFTKEYAKMRGIEYNDSYGGGRWIDNIREIIADDFRILMADTDKDFYLHTCKHPLKSPEVKKFWEELKEKYSV